jgi:hypothetical protein
MLMKTAAALILAGAFVATPSLAATTYTTSWEGTVTEMQKKGPNAKVRGPDRAGGYYVSGGRQPRALWTYRWRSPFR